MDLGLGFLVGVLAGSIVSIIAATILYFSRKATGKTTAVIPRPADAESRRSATGDKSAAGGRSGHTMVIDNVDTRENQLNKNVQEVRDLLLKLADVVSHTDAASGKAAKAFNSAKDVIDKLDLTSPDDLADAQQVLVTEIDRVLRTNATLHDELERANKGIAEQRRQIEELRVQARIDGLTRIPNRAAFDERLKEFISLLDRTSMVFSLLLIDIDFFKAVNDQHGHPNGDRILRGVAAKITDGIRTNDFAARYGGEEFAVIFPATKAEEALAVSDRLRQDIAKTNFRLDTETVKMTISAGLAQCAKGMTPETILTAADAALYKAKNKGRNRVEIAET